MTNKDTEQVLTPLYEIVNIKQVIREREDFVRYVIRSPRDAVTHIQKEIGDSDREKVIVLCLNTKNEVIAFHIAHIGSLNASILTPREIFKTAILNNSNSIILAHNHPSGHPTPSQEDIAITKRVKEGGDLLGIELLDHLIVTDRTYTSLKEKGYM